MGPGDCVGGAAAVGWALMEDAVVLRGLSGRCQSGLLPAGVYSAREARPVPALAGRLLDPKGSGDADLAIASSGAVT